MDEGTITINLAGGTGARAAVYPPKDKSQLDYEITLSDDNGTISITANGEETIRRTVPAGYYNVKVKASLDGKPYAKGEDNVEIIAGQNNVVTITLYKDFDKIWTVTFDANGGTPVPEQIVIDGECAEMPFPNPELDGFGFAGWYTDEEVRWEFETDTVTKDIILYAKWEWRQSVFDVTEPAHWEDALDVISRNPSGSYTINVKANVTGVSGIEIEIDGESGVIVTAPTFGRSNSSLTVNIIGGGSETTSLALTGAGSLIYIGAKQSVTIKDVALKGHEENNTSLVYIAGGNAKFEMNGEASVTGNTAGNGGGVYVKAGGALTMKDKSSVYKNTAGIGGGVFVDGGRFEMYGESTVSKNTAKGVQVSGAGGVYVKFGGVFIMDNDSSVSENISNSFNSFSTSGNGGGVQIYAPSQDPISNFIMRGNASVCGNVADSNGGGVYVQEFNSNFTMEGGVIYDNAANGNGSNQGGAGIFISLGKVHMTGGIIVGDSPYTYEETPYAANIIGGSLGGGAALSSGNGTAQYGTFSGPNEGWVSNGDLATRNTPTRIDTTIHVIDGIRTFIVNDEADDWHSAVNAIRTGGNDNKYNIILTDIITIPGYNTVDPSNGGTKAIETTFANVTGISVNISGGGTLKLAAGEENNGALLNINKNQSVTIKDIHLEGRGTDGVINTASLVRVDGARFTMETGSSLSGNTNTGDVGVIVGNGGGVLVIYGGEFIMNGGDISNNKANLGGGVYVFNGGATFKMSGKSVISGNTASATGGGGGVYVHGETGITFETFEMIGGEISGNNTTAATGGHGGGVYVNTGIFKMTGGVIGGDTPNTTNGNGGGVYVNGNATFKMSDTAVISRNTAATNGGGVFVAANGAFKMSDTTVITGNTATGTGVASGGGVFIAGNGATFEMSGASVISGNNAGGNGPTAGGGGVCVNGGTFTMTGGTIGGNAPNTALNGGGVFVATNGAFKMSGASVITGNTATGTGTTAGGGGVYVTGNGTTFEMTGGTIGGNAPNTALNGGGVYVYNGGATFKMSGASFITGNTATANGGGVYVNNGGTLQMAGGIIVGNDPYTYPIGGTTTYTANTSSGLVTGAALFKGNNGTFQYGILNVEGDFTSGVNFAAVNATINVEGAIRVESGKLYLEDVQHQP